MPGSEPVIVVRDVHKEFILPQHKNTSLKQVFVNLGRRNVKKHQKVLDGVSFNIQKGDFFGIVGRNGSGKSTLLKILAGVYTPTTGEVQVNGALTPFIELGVGFNPELSGRDNVYLNGALLGFSRKEMSAMYEEIVEFAELGEYMEKKLKNYSSGMQVRLAFSIAIKARNDILIFDEVLAVGDEAFQRKCLDVFEQYKAAKQTVVLVTHDMESVKRYCNKAMLLSDGKIIEMGDPRKVARSYSKLNEKEIDRGVEGANARQQEARYLVAKVTDQLDKARQRFDVGETLRAHVSWAGLDSARLESIGVNIFKKSGEHITGFNTRFDKKLIDWRSGNELTLDLKLDITPGKYYLLIEAFESEGKAVDAIFDGPQFTVSDDKGIEWSGLFELPHSWGSK